MQQVLLVFQGVMATSPAASSITVLLMLHDRAPWFLQSELAWRICIALWLTAPMSHGGCFYCGLAGSLADR